MEIVIRINDEEIAALAVLIQERLEKQKTEKVDRMFATYLARSGRGSQSPETSQSEGCEDECAEPGSREE